MKPFSLLIATNLLRLRRAFWRLIYRSYARRYRISPTFRYNGVGIHLYGDGRIDLGADSYIGEYSSVHACTGHEVRIGSRCRIAHHVRIYTATSSADSDFRTSDGTPVEGDVTIGDGVWVGVNVYIGPGISIGANSVIGANAVVTRNVPANEIWGGVPARRIRAKAVQPP